MGKSTLITHLLSRMSRRFDLVISFTGTTACSPEMRDLMESRWDPRFQFSEWRQPLMDALLKQQEELKSRGVERQIMVLVDDIILNSKDEDALSHLCLRGRHFNISVLACAVSYTTLPKRCRRSLDALPYEWRLSNTVRRVRSPQQDGSLHVTTAARVDMPRHGNIRAQAAALPLPCLQYMSPKRSVTGPRTRQKRGFWRDILGKS